MPVCPSSADGARLYFLAQNLLTFHSKEYDCISSLTCSQQETSSFQYPTAGLMLHLLMSRAFASLSSCNTTLNKWPNSCLFILFSFYQQLESKNLNCLPLSHSYRRTRTRLRHDTLVDLFRRKGSKGTEISTLHDISSTPTLFPSPRAKRRRVDELYTESPKKYYTL